MKRIAALLFALVIAITCFSFCANAEGDAVSGSYNGYNYYCAGTLKYHSFYLEMQYYNNTTTTLKIQGSYNYWPTSGPKITQPLWITGKTAIYGIQLPDNFRIFSSAAPSFYIGSHFVASFSLSATPD